MPHIQNILVAVDFTETDKAILEYALQVAQKFSARVWFVHVAMPDPYFVGYGPGPQYIRDLRAGELHKEHKTLKQYAGDFISAGIDAEGLLVQGPAAETFLDEAKKLDISLFVMGVHKHGFIDRIFKESYPSELAFKLKIPFLIVP